MDSKTRRRRRMIKVALTEALMVVAVVIVVGVMMFFASGNKIGSDWDLEQTGLVQIHSFPTGATITIDGEGIFYRTNTSRTMTVGAHEMILSHDGYDSWSKVMNVRAGMLYRLYYPRLFPISRKAEEVLDLSGAKFLSVSPNRKNLLVLTEKGAWELLSLGDEATAKTLKFKVLEGIKLNNIEVMWWSENGDRVLTRVGNDYVILDIKNPAKSLDLTKTFGLKFELLVAENYSAERIFGFVKDDLYEIDVMEGKISKVLLEDASVELAKIIGEKKVDLNKAVLTEYYGDSYLTVVVGTKMLVFQGEQPTVDNGFKMELLLSEELDFAPTRVEAGRIGEFVVASDGARVAVMDAETAEVSQFVVENADLGWLDEYLIYTIVDGKMVVRDFDGTNRRELSDGMAQKAYGMISTNDRWLYYVNAESTLMREKLVL